MSRTSRLNVVVERPSDAVLLGRLLSRALSLRPKFYAGDGRLSLATLARNILVHEGGPLLLVMDADSADPARAAEARAMTQAALRQVAVDQSFAVFAFIPQLEVVFFEAYPVLQAHLGADALSSGPLVGRLDPQRTLQSALEREGIPRDAFVRALTQRDLDVLLEGPQLRALVASVGSLIGSEGGVLGSAA